MSAELHIIPGQPGLKKEEFIRGYPGGSIALDGFVYGPSWFNEATVHENVNHHEEVDRLGTYSTAQQIIMKMRMGMALPYLDDGGNFSPQVYVNDCDQDVCASWFLLANPHLIVNPDDMSMAAEYRNPELSRFVDVAGRLDTTAGMYPYDLLQKELRDISWVFSPYQDFRRTMDYCKGVEPAYRAVIEEVGERIMCHILGEGGTIGIPEMRRIAHYDTLATGSGWSMITAERQEGVTQASYDGNSALVKVQVIDDGEWLYSIMRRSDYVPFPIFAIAKRLNELDSRPDDTWGGSDIVIGSPRRSHSSIPPEDLFRVIEEIVTSS